MKDAQHIKHNTMERTIQSAKSTVFRRELCRICQLLYFSKNVIIKTAQERPVRKHRQCKETDEAIKSRSKEKYGKDGAEKKTI